MKTLKDAREKLRVKNKLRLFQKAIKLRNEFEDLAEPFAELLLDKVEKAIPSLARISKVILKELKR